VKIALPELFGAVTSQLRRLHIIFLRRTTSSLYRAYCRHLGRSGWARARELICASADRADSAAERLLIRILRAAG
jgi:hypothetical protein